VSRELPLAAGVGLLVAGTWSVQTSWERYDLVGPELLDDGGFDRGLEAWESGGYGGEARVEQGAVVLSVTPPCERPTCGAVLIQDLPVPDAGILVLGASTATEGVGGPITSVGELNVYLVPRAADGTGLWDEALTAVSQTGTSPWTTERYGMDVQPHWTSLTVLVQLRAAEGLARADDVTLRAATPRAAWRLALDGLAGGWLVAAFGTLVQLARTPGTRFRGAFVAACIAGLGLLVLPARYVDGAVDAMVAVFEAEADPIVIPAAPSEVERADTPASPTAATTTKEPGEAAPMPDESVLRGTLREAAPHFSLFVLLGALAALAFPGAPAGGVGVRMLAFAGTTEVLQLFTPDRGPSLEDIVADTAGVALGLAVARLVTRRWASRPSGA
jgi:hypothetical protein